jgi:hypothetical protein
VVYLVVSVGIKLNLRIVELLFFSLLSWPCCYFLRYTGSPTCLGLGFVDGGGGAAAAADAHTSTLDIGQCVREHPQYSFYVVFS